ncbi:unnamed protein product [Medioppia subpectinata]|uniref:EF-hand domain-containing protein n=1 Tax=Medioppia subpectinata TaxID=1979941 RepID=A0A7R9KYE7_9ACAR|nr:unnamed protein product [Medioppia subpectinata]CAG2111088.1 unnamed protein product [Medioppia subpectinata]
MDTKNGTKGVDVETTAKKTHKYDINDETVADIKQAFKQFDAEDKGLIAAKDVKFAVRGLGFEPKKEEINKLVEQMDRNKSGLICYEDFLSVMAKRFAEKDTNDEIMKAFQLFDVNKSGTICFENLKTVAKELGETLTDEELREMIVEADRDGDGLVSSQEFFRIMKKTCLY